MLAEAKINVWKQIYVGKQWKTSLPAFPTYLQSDIFMLDFPMFFDITAVDGQNIQTLQQALC